MSTKQKFYIDPTGEKIPAKYISAYDKKRDAIAQRIAKLWLDERRRLENVKEKTMALIDEVRSAAAKDAGVKLGGKKGYLQFRDFRGQVVVRFENVERTEFDERISMVQQLINEAIEDMATGAGRSGKAQELRKVAEAAFRPRGKDGKLDRQRVRDIANVKINHPKWRKAAELIRECDKVVGHKPYIRVMLTNDVGIAPHQPIVLDIADCRIGRGTS